MAWCRLTAPLSSVGLASQPLDLVLHPLVAVLQGGVPVERCRTSRGPHPHRAFEPEYRPGPLKHAE